MESFLVYILSSLAAVGFFLCCAFWMCGAGCHLRNPCDRGPVGFFCPGDEAPPEENPDVVIARHKKAERRARRKKRQDREERELRAVVVAKAHHDAEAEIEGRPESGKKEHAARLAQKRAQREKRRHQRQRDHNGHKRKEQRHREDSEEKDSSSSSDTSSGSEESHGEPDERKSDLDFLRAATLRAVEIRLEALNKPQVMPVSADPAEYPASRPSSKSLSGNYSKESLVPPGHNRSSSSSRPVSSIELDRQVNSKAASGSSSSRPASSMDLDRQVSNSKSGGSARPASSLDLDRPSAFQAVPTVASLAPRPTDQSRPVSSPNLDQAASRSITSREPSAPPLSRDNSAVATSTERPVSPVSVTPTSASAPPLPRLPSPAYPTPTPTTPSAPLASSGPSSPTPGMPVSLDRPGSSASLSTVPGAPPSSSTPSVPPRMKNRSYYRSHAIEQPPSSSEFLVTVSSPSPQPGLGADDVSVRSGGSSQPGGLRVQGEMASVRSAGMGSEGASVRSAVSGSQPGL